MKKKKVLDEIAETLTKPQKRGRGRPKGSYKTGERSWSINGKEIIPLYIESIRALKLYLSRLIRGMEQGVITTTLGNAIVNACRILLECLRENKNEKIIEERIKKLEEMFDAIRSKQTDNGIGEVGWPTFVPSIGSRKKSDSMDNLI